MWLWYKLKKHFVPTLHNAYRPPVLGRASLIFFFCLALAVEGFLVAGLMARESDGSFFSAVISSDIISFTNSERNRARLGTLPEDVLLSNAASIGFTEWAQSFVQAAGREVAKDFSDPSRINWILGSIAAFMLAAVLLAYFIHIDVQAHDMVLGGVIVAAFALVCMGANMRFLSSGHTQTAVVIDSFNAIDAQFSSSEAR